MATRFFPYDKLWLDPRDIYIQKPSRKLYKKRLDLFQIIEAIKTHAYVVILQLIMKTITVFCVSFLKKAAADPFEEWFVPLSPSVIIMRERIIMRLRKSLTLEQSEESSNT